MTKNLEKANGLEQCRTWTSYKVVQEKIIFDVSEKMFSSTAKVGWWCKQSFFIIAHWQFCFAKSILGNHTKLPKLYKKSLVMNSSRQYFVCNRKSIVWQVLCFSKLMLYATTMETVASVLRVFSNATCSQTISDDDLISLGGHVLSFRYIAIWHRPVATGALPSNLFMSPNFVVHKNLF